MVRESEIPVLIHFMLFCAARNSGMEQMRADLVNAKFGIGQEQLDAMQQAHESNKSLAEGDVEAEEVEVVPAAKKKRVTPKK